MPRRPKRLRVPALALIALVVLFPALTSAAAPREGESLRAPAEHRQAAATFFAQLRSLLSLLWENGSGLEPNGGKPGAPNATTSGDNGSGLEPNG